MKKILIIFLCVFLFGCSDNTLKEDDKSVNIQKKKYYSYAIKKDDYVSVVSNNYVNENINNNIIKTNEIYEEKIEDIEDTGNTNNEEFDIENINNTSSSEEEIEDVINTDINEDEVINESNDINENIILLDEETEEQIDTLSINLEENEIIIEEDNNLISTYNIDDNEKTEEKAPENKEEIKEESTKSEEEMKGYYTPLGTYLADSKVKVIDISHHQGIIDFDSFINSDSYYGIILRIGYYDTMDKLFERNISEIKRLNIPYGIYLFSYSIDSDEAKKEAFFTNSIIDKYDLKPNLGIYYDIESFKTNKKNSDNISKDMYDSIISTYVDLVSLHVNNLYKVKVYSNRWYAMNRLGLKAKSYVDWVAEYNDTCKYDSNYSMWQYTSKGKVEGINGNVDISYLY